jgi:hypothetical protein
MLVIIYRRFGPTFTGPAVEEERRATGWSIIMQQMVMDFLGK